jgi:hypothetical protein
MIADREVAKRFAFRLGRLIFDRAIAGGGVEADADHADWERAQGLARPMPSSSIERDRVLRLVNKAEGPVQPEELAAARAAVPALVDVALGGVPRLAGQRATLLVGDDGAIIETAFERDLRPVRDLVDAAVEAGLGSRPIGGRNETEVSRNLWRIYVHPMLSDREIADVENALSRELAGSTDAATSPRDIAGWRKGMLGRRWRL